VTRRVLIVDDTAVNVKLAAALLRLAGCDPLSAPDGEQGIALARELRPALILMDIELPGIDGLETTRRLKQDPATAAIPVLALTAFAMQGDRERALAAGCDGYLTKPIDTREFASAIEPHLVAREARR
jgi:CheY-like chemotaxis protein